jgi:hypothetical protein
MDTANRNAYKASQLSTAAISALHQGNKIAAIKIVREERKIGLKEAKDAVEDYVLTQPALQVSLAASQTAAKRNALRWLVILVGLILVAYYFMAQR